MSSKIIPKEQLSAYQRWELSALDEAVQRSRKGPGKSDEDVVLPTAEELERIHQQAYREGFTAGMSDGRNAAAAEIAQLRLLIPNLQEVIRSFEEQLAQDAVSLALELAKQVIRRTVNIQADLILPVVREALTSLPQLNQPVKLILHPDDAALVRSMLENDASIDSPWKIVENARIEKGGCMIESQTSEIDATLESRWKRIIAAIGRDDAWTEEPSPPKKPIPPS